MTPFTALTAAEAGNLFAESRPGTFDAVLMDVMMPNMDGLAATRAIRGLPRPDAAVIPIIAMTANAFDEDVRRCLEADMNAHLSKPIQIKNVVQTITACLEKSNKTPAGVRLPKKQKLGFCASASG